MREYPRRKREFRKIEIIEIEKGGNRLIPVLLPGENFNSICRYPRNRCSQYRHLSYLKRRFWRLRTPGTPIIGFISKTHIAKGIWDVYRATISTPKKIDNGKRKYRCIRIYTVPIFSVRGCNAFL